MNEMKKMMVYYKKLKIDYISATVKENEFDMINLDIKIRLNKGVKELIKLYQATINGYRGINLHSKYDSIPNKLIIIKSAGNRRFECFTTVQWLSPSNGGYKDIDLNAFLFSLDKQKIYSYKSDFNDIYDFKGRCT